MPYASVRTSRNTRIGGGPLFWLILGPFILVGYLLIGAFMLLSVAGAFVVTLAQAAMRSRTHRRKTPTRHP